MHDSTSQEHRTCLRIATGQTVVRAGKGIHHRATTRNTLHEEWRPPARRAATRAPLQTAKAEVPSLQGVRECAVAPFSPAEARNAYRLTP